MIPQRVMQRSTAPRYLVDLKPISFSIDPLSFYVEQSTRIIRFSASIDQSWKIGMTDLLIELYGLGQTLPSEREILSFIKDNSYQEFPTPGSEHDQFLKTLVLNFNRYLLQQQKDLLQWSSASMVDKLNAVKGLLAMRYVGVELIDVDDDTVVVSLGLSSKCEGDKILESIQDYLQNQLKSHKINVIPEF
jgi:hypothetical protein